MGKNLIPVLANAFLNNVTSLSTAMCDPSEETVFHDGAIYRSCVVQSQACTFSVGTCSVEDLPKTEVNMNDGGSISPIFPYRAFRFEPYGPADLTKPAFQPGDGIYTSPLTVNVIKTATLDNVLEVIAAVLRVFRMPMVFDGVKFKYDVAVYFTSGFARFSVRVWRHGHANVNDQSSDPPIDSYAVEVMRERGDRILVMRFFDLLCNALASCASKEAYEAIVADYDRDFTVEVFDWAPHALPLEVLARLPEPSAEDVAAGLASSIDLAGSTYDDVAANGCASVAKLAVASTRTRRNMANSHNLIYVLLCVLTSFGRAPLSVDTRSNAALALAELVDDKDGPGAKRLAAIFYSVPETLHTIASLCIDGIPDTPTYTCSCLRTACIRLLTVIVSSDVSFLDVAQRVLTTIKRDEYMPLSMAVQLLSTAYTSSC